MADLRCKEEYLRRIHKVQDYIEQHIGESMSIEDLANAAGFSKYHFSRIFQGVLQESPAQYVYRIRMEYAMFLLAHRTDKKMTDIAFELGFTDSAVFSRAFKNFSGISPRESYIFMILFKCTFLIRTIRITVINSSSYFTIFITL